MTKSQHCTTRCSYLIIDSECVSVFLLLYLKQSTSSLQPDPYTSIVCRNRTNSSKDGSLLTPRTSENYKVPAFKSLRQMTIRCMASLRKSNPLPSVRIFFINLMLKFLGSSESGWENEAISGSSLTELWEVVGDQVLRNLFVLFSVSIELSYPLSLRFVSVLISSIIPSFDV